MKLSQRIYALCSQIDEGQTVADIGTDHGYVPLLLVKNKVSPWAIMSDISRSSLSTSMASFKQENIYCDPKNFRVGDGLSSIEPAEVDAVVIAGLGGITISEIIEEDIEKARSFKKLVLQPRKHSGDLRYCLDKNGFDITKEVLVPEGKFICEIIVAKPGEQKKREPKYKSSDIRYAYPEEFSNLELDFVEHRISHKLENINAELISLSKSKYDNFKLKAQLNFEKEYLTELLEKTRCNALNG